MEGFCYWWSANVDAGFWPYQTSERVSGFRLLRSVKIPEFQMIAPQQLPALYQRLLRDIACKRLPPRRLHSNPWMVKRKMSNFKLKRVEHRPGPQPSVSFREAIELKKSGEPTSSTFLYLLPLPTLFPVPALT